MVRHEKEDWKTEYDKENWRFLFMKQHGGYSEYELRQQNKKLKALRKKMEKVM